MSLPIILGTSGVDWRGDANGSGRVTLYKSDGTPHFTEYEGSYMVRIEIIPTTVTAATTYFAMHNLGTKRAFIRKIEMKEGFSGTAAASRSIFEFERLFTATPTGGTALTALKKNNNTMPTSSVSDIRYAPGGLTTTGVTWEAPFFLAGVTNQLNTDFAQDLDFANSGEQGKFVLNINEGLAIRANTALVAGAYLIGQISWDEYT